MAKVPDKFAFYRLTAEGRLGNQMACWDSLEAMKASGSEGPFMLRYAGTTGCGKFEPRIPRHKIERVVARWIRDGADPARIRIWESPPIKRVVMCGEFMRAPETANWYLMYSTRRRMHMNTALRKHARHAHGFTALMILRHVLDAASYESFMALIDEFPSAVIEFQTFECKLGLLRRNSVIWEVRDY